MQLLLRLLPPRRPHLRSWHQKRTMLARMRTRSHSQDTQMLRLLHPECRQRPAEAASEAVFALVSAADDMRRTASVRTGCSAGQRAGARNTLPNLCSVCMRNEGLANFSPAARHGARVRVSGWWNWWNWKHALDCPGYQEVNRPDWLQDTEMTPMQQFLLVACSQSAQKAPGATHTSQQCCHRRHDWRPRVGLFLKKRDLRPPHWH